MINYSPPLYQLSYRRFHVTGGCDCILYDQPLKKHATFAERYWSRGSFPMCLTQCSVRTRHGTYWGRSSDGRALAQHARGTGIDTRRLHKTVFCFLLVNIEIKIFYPVLKLWIVLSLQAYLKKKGLHRPGIEPGPPAWQASILPLNQRCFLMIGRLVCRNHTSL